MTIELKNHPLQDIALVSFEVISALKYSLCPFLCSCGAVRVASGWDMV